MLSKKTTEVVEWIDISNNIFDLTIVTKYFLFGFKVYKSISYRENSFEKEVVESKVYEE